MDFADGLFEILEIGGTVSFAVSGAMVAIRKKVDLFGVIFLAVITALGGGMLRDIMLRQIPPVLFTSSVYVGLAVFAAVIVFVLARIFREKYLSRESFIDHINNIFDALGLGIFTVIGIRVCAEAGYGDHMLLSVCMGMLTGFGGGLIRDLMVMEIPFVLRKRVYAVASLTGGILYYVFRYLGAAEWIGVSVGVVWIFGMRMLATKYQWNLPKAIPDNK